MIPGLAARHSPTMTAKSSKGPSNGRRPKQPMGAYFRSLTLKNIRCFGSEQTLDLCDANGNPARWTVILGENGTGKTTLLQALALSMELLEPACSNSDQREAHAPVSSGWLRAVERGDAQFSAQFCAATRPGGTCSEVTSVSAMRYPDSFVWRQPSDPIAGVSRLTYGYGASRRVGGPSISNSVYGSNVTSLFDPASGLLNPEEWLMRLDYAAKGKERKRALRIREIATNLLTQILPDIAGVDFDPGKGARPTPRVQFHTDYGWVPLEQVSLGYQSMIAWVVDLVSRMMDAAGESVDDPLSLPAVVLVDELDLHLHPAWQREIIDHLTKSFPNTQFIVTAHSPLVVQSAEGANLVLLRKKPPKKKGGFAEVEIVNDVDTIRNWRIDQIYTSELFGLPSARPPHIDKLLAERNKLLGKAKLTKADQSRLKKIEAEIGPLPAGDTPEMRRILQLLEEAGSRGSA